MVSTPDLIIDNSPLDVGMLDTMNKPSARKSLSQFLALFFIKLKTALHRLGAAKKKQKEIYIDSALFSMIRKRIGHKKLMQV